MVDVGHKPDTERSATARGEVRMRPETLALIQAGAMKKGDVLTVAQLAGVMGAKRTAELIPLCHPLPLTRVAGEFVTTVRFGRRMAGLRYPTAALDLRPLRVEYWR